MTATLRFLVLLALIALSTALCADEDPTPADTPLRLKKKDRPTPALPEPNKKLVPPKDEPPPRVRTPAEAEPKEGGHKQGSDGAAKQTLARLNRNLRQSAERLTGTDPGDSTRRLQHTILDDFDALILEQQQPRQQAQEQQSDPQQSPEEQERRARRQQRQRVQQQQALQRQEQRSAGAENKPGNSGGGARAGGGTEETNKLADLYKDVWGHLPESLRLEMNQYSREQFMGKYSDLLKQYYVTVAEKGRRKGD